MARNSDGMGRLNDRHLLLQRIGESENQRRRQHADRMPTAEDHGRQSDKASARGHILIEAADEAEREPSATKARDHAAQRHVDVAHRIDVDAERVGRPRVLAHGARPQAGARVE